MERSSSGGLDLVAAMCRGVVRGLSYDWWGATVAHSSAGADSGNCGRVPGTEAPPADNTPVIEALVQTVTLTEDRAASTEQISRQIPGASAQDVARTPFLLIGTYQQMAAQLLAQAEDYGITSYRPRASHRPPRTRAGHAQRVNAGPAARPR